MEQKEILKLNENDTKVLRHYLEASKSGYIGKGNIEIIPIESIQIIKGNPNKHSKEHTADIIRNITKDGLMIPILKNSKNQLITGEGRLISLKEMGCTHIA